MCGVLAVNSRFNLFVKRAVGGVRRVSPPRPSLRLCHLLNVVYFNLFGIGPRFTTITNTNTNIALNQDASSAPVTVWPFALSSHEGFSTIHVVNGNYGASRVVAGDDGVRVETRTLDGLLASEHGRVSLIKIDVEGHEKEVLEGARHVITRDKPVIFIEILPDTPTGEGTRELLYGYGYVVRR